MEGLIKRKGGYRRQSALFGIALVKNEYDMHTRQKKLQPMPYYYRKMTQGTLTKYKDDYLKGIITGEEYLERVAAYAREHSRRNIPARPAEETTEDTPIEIAAEEMDKLKKIVDDVRKEMHNLVTMIDNDRNLSANAAYRWAEDIFAAAFDRTYNRN